MTTRPAAPAQRPFLAAPEASRYFAAAAIEDARRRVARCIDRREGAALVIGAAGTGKSLLLEVLAAQFAGKALVARLQGAQLCTRRALWQMLLFELGLPYRGMEEGELRLELKEHLRPRDGATRRLLLLVDEAHALPVRLLDELRAMTNLAAAGAPLVTVVLAGGPQLEERFADPQLEAFSQRAATRCYLAPLERSETVQYLRAQLAAAGKSPETVLAADAMVAIHEATGGVPRLINQLGDQLMWMADETGMAPLDASMVQQAWADLQQLPAPWQQVGGEQGVAGVIEFGVLGGDDDFIGDSELDEAFEGEDDLELGDPDAEESEEGPAERVASIPITALADQRRLSASSVAADLDAAERLLSTFDAVGIVFDDPVAADVGEPQQPAAENPFDDRFDEEEVLVDPYADFESSLLAKAPRVFNRIDAMLATQLVVPAAPRTESAKSIVVEIAETAAPVAAPLPAAAPRLSEPAAVARDLLVIEEDELPIAQVVSARQFRRLFSNLEAGMAAGM